MSGKLLNVIATSEDIMVTAMSVKNEALCQ